MSEYWEGHTGRIQSLHLHIALYSKFWYKRSDDIIKDLKQMNAVWSGCKVEYIRDQDVYEHVIQTAFGLCPAWKLLNYMERWFNDFNSQIIMGPGRRQGTMTLSDIVGELLTCISLTANDELPKGIKLPDPDPKLLPTNSKEPENARPYTPSQPI